MIPQHFPKLILCVILACTLKLHSQSTDSLRAVLANAKTDSARVELLIEIGITTTDTAEAAKSLNEAITLARRSGYRRGLARSYRASGIVAYDNSQLSRAVYWHTMALKSWSAIGDQEEIAKCYQSLGVLDANFKNDRHAIWNFHRAIAINVSLNNEKALRQNYFEIAECFMRLKQPDSALYFLNRSLAIALKTGYPAASVYRSLAAAYLYRNQQDSCARYLFKSDSAFKSIGSEFGIQWNNVTRGQLLMERNSFSEAMTLLESTWQFAVAHNDAQLLFAVTPELLKCYHQTGDDKKGFSLQEKWDRLQDSIRNSDLANQALGMQLEFQEAQRLSLDSLARVQTEAIHAETESRQRITTGAVVIILLLVLVIATFIYRGYRKTRKTNEVISQQKKLVEEKQKEVVESITYARRLQTAILPPLRMVRKMLPESFIFYQPKDIVAGDFYWMESRGSDVFFAVADCTGHGVPGAIVSVVCANALSSAVNDFNLSDTGAILDRVRELVIATFEKSESEVMDGMDISLLKFSHDSNTIQWSGANNPLWIICDGELHEVKGDKQPIGIFEHVRPFTTHTVEFGKGAIAYLFTDGYADQFGGEKGKKFRYKQLSELLLAIATRPMNEQEEVLRTKIAAWRGELDQVDDICIAGIRNA